MSPLWKPLEALPPVHDDPAVRAAVLVPLYEDRGRLRVVLTRRPDEMRTHAGDVVFPGGRLEPGDAGPIDAAVREAHEEIGLDPSDVEVLGGLDPVTPRDPTMIVVPVVARIRRPEVFVPQPEEVASILEPTIDELLDDAAWITSDWNGFTMWFYEFSDGVLWGATAFMVRQLLDILRPTQEGGPEGPPSRIL